ncbi:YafY family protein [Lentilitoribacter sp. Alg239-R112]|uniref:helix-turn-helix transcriptional regulator n=1 Tax=Lentilitoribacter sp. Alg239-R112 TaxID=2305987 RepID=UPI0013A6E878|nr:YafY family protein [Lentilitoribacter sp. Alg239-R112]
MSRSQRLLDLLQVLRQHRLPVSGSTLAEEMNISLRTLYRDIATLRSHGANIEGEAGMGYILAPGFMLPPLMFSEDEISALVLGSRWVSDRADMPLAKAARNALAKVTAVLPDDLKERAETNDLVIGPSFADAMRVENSEHMEVIRKAIRNEHIMQINYTDAYDNVSSRVIWPIMLTYFEHSRVIVAWCEARKAYRHFRTDRVSSLEDTGKRYYPRKPVLVKQWRMQEGLEE